MSDWWCEKCQFSIYGHKDVCRKCQTRRPEAPAAVIPFSVASHVTAPRSVLVASSLFRSGDWNCRDCNAHNYAKNRTCFKCKVVKTIGTATPIVGAREEMVTDATHECVVCTDAVPAIVFMPCQHMACCAACSERIGKQCPLCRANIVNKIKPFQV